MQPDEKAVCSDSALSKLDDDLAYKVLLGSKPDEAETECEAQRASLRDMHHKSGSRIAGIVAQMCS
jgi:uncharacterized protein